MAIADTSQSLQGGDKHGHDKKESVFHNIVYY